MEKILYCPEEEAEEKGLKVQFINFKKINSLLVKGIIYLRDSMNQIEKRCCLTYEIVHYTRMHTESSFFCTGHSIEEEEIIRQDTARKLVHSAKLYYLLENCYTMDKVAEELKITKEVLNDYFKYCKNKKVEEFSVL